MPLFYGRMMGYGVLGYPFFEKFKKSFFVFDFADNLLAKNLTFSKSQLFRQVFVPLIKAKS